MAFTGGVKIEGLDAALASFKNLDAELRRNANSELRQASKQIASALVPMLGGSGAPQEAKILAAAGPKSDRLVAVAVPSRKPGLSGVKKTPAKEAKSLGFAIEAGSDEKQFHGPPAGGMVGKNIKRITAYAIPRYEQSLLHIMRKYGLI